MIYTICTLVTNKSQYFSMKESFIASGFTEKDCEFVYIDNTEGNIFEAYAGLNNLIDQATGKMIICCHQDILMLENSRTLLEKQIEIIEEFDKNWGVISNCGANRIAEYALRVIDSEEHEYNTNNFPLKVKSVDEHFFIFRKSSNLRFSGSLSGFHLYGTDICLKAHNLKQNSYVVDFLLRHFGRGTLNKDFFICRDNLVHYYSNTPHIGWVQTTCYRIFISPYRLLNVLLNLKKISYLVKKYNKLVLKIGHSQASMK